MPHLAKRRSLGLFGGDPVVDAFVEDAQRQGTVPNDLVVEGADVELVAELGGGSSAEILQFQFAQLVGQRLAGPDDVAVDLDGDVVLRFAGIGLEEIDRPLA